MKPNTTPFIEPKRVRDLVTLLCDLSNLHEQLSRQLDDKLTALKKADVDAMTAIAEKLAATVQRINDREGLRKQWLDNIAPTVGLSSKAARALKASQLMTLVKSEQRSSLQQSLDALRIAVDRVRHRNGQIANISRGILGHLAWVLSSVTPRTAAETTYSAKGINPTKSGAMLLEAMG